LAFLSLMSHLFERSEASTTILAAWDPFVLSKLLKSEAPVLPFPVNNSMSSTPSFCHVEALKMKEKWD